MACKTGIKVGPAAAKNILDHVIEHEKDKQFSFVVKEGKVTITQVVDYL